jgi:Na+/melibiose symporter-like transporter
VAGIVLDVVDLPTGAAPGEVPAETVFALGLGVGPGIFLIWVVAGIVLSRYALRRSDHARIMAELSSRRGTGQGAPAVNT